MDEGERKIAVEWARTASDTFPVRVLVHTEDRPGILNQLTAVLFNEQTNIRSLEARGADGRGTAGAIIELTGEGRDKKQLERVISSIRRISRVHDMERANPSASHH